MDELVAPGLNSRLTFGGLATGLDTGALVEALIQAESRPLTLLRNRRNTLSAQQQAMQDLSNRLLTLRDAARAVDNRSSGLSGPAATEELLRYAASSSDESVLEVETTGDIGPGSVEVRIDRLTTSAREVSVGFADPDAPMSPSGGVLLVSGGIDFGVIVNATDSLNDVRDAINANGANDGFVQADVLYDGSEYRLVLSGAEAGAANDFSVVSTIQPGGSPLFDAILSVDAEDAQLEYLGVTITRPTNEITDLVPDVTLRLRGTSPDPVSIDVVRDDEAIEASLQELVDAFNAVRQFSIDQTTLDEETNRGGLLIGDSLLRGVESRLQTLLQNRYTFPDSPDNPFDTLGEIGLRFDARGLLELDGETLRAALDEDREAVRELLSGDGTTDGIATALAVYLEPVVAPSDPDQEGLFEAREDGFDLRIEGIDLQIARMEERLAQREEFLIRQFSQLESLISSIQAQAGFLNFSSLNNNGNR